MMKCPKCGLENNESNKFCQGCGTPMQQTSDIAPSATEIQQQPKKAWYKHWWIWLIIGLGVITLLLGGTCTACTCALLSQPATNPTSESSTQEQSTAFTPYYTDSKREFHDISYEYNSHWNESESTLKNGYEYHIDNPKISFAVYALTYSSEQEVETLIEEYRKTKDSGKLIDEKTYDFENTPAKVHRFMRTNTGEDKSVQYNDIATLAYLGYYYTFIVKSDYDNRDQCEDIMKQTIYSIKLYEETTTAPSTAAPTTKKPTEAPTEKKTEKPTEPPTEKQTEKPTEGISREYSNALKQAESYLKHSAFSKDGLYEQLLFEKYSEDAATYAVEHVSTDWNANALKKAESYISHTAFSQEGLYEQLLFEKYTEEQARYGANNVKADWNEMAVKKAESYLKLSSFSKDDLYEQLIFEKYTPEQAQYAVDKVY